MKVVHVLKKIEMIDQDIKELRKLEKSVVRNKSFSTPIYMSIEKQINILLGERIKLLELKITNPPEQMVAEIEGDDSIINTVEEKEKNTEIIEQKEAEAIKKPKTVVKKSSKDVKPARQMIIDRDDVDLDNNFEMLTQDLIDEKIKSIQSEKDEMEKLKKTEKTPISASSEEKSENVKLLDIALEKGTLNKKEIEKEKEKDKKVRFFRENFPLE